MPQILIRGLDATTIHKLQTQATAAGISAEEEARRILRRSLIAESPDLSLIEFLRTMPDVDDDHLFDRQS